MTLFHLFAQALIELRLAYFRAARDHLTRRAPFHQDLPQIIHMINYLESRRSGAFSVDKT